MTQAPPTGFQVVNNFFTRPEPVKQPVTLQKRGETEGARSAQVQAEEELARQEKRIALQEKELTALKDKIRACTQAGQQVPPQLVQRARLLNDDIVVMHQLCDNLRRRCLQVDKAQTAGRVVRLQEQLAQEEQQALAGVSEASVQRTNVQSRAADKRIDRVFDRLTGMQHLDPEEVSTANDAFLADLMREPTSAEPARTLTNTTAPVSTVPSGTYVKGSNRMVDDILRL